MRSTRCFLQLTGDVWALFVCVKVCLPWRARYDARLSYKFYIEYSKYLLLVNSNLNTYFTELFKFFDETIRVFYGNRAESTFAVYISVWNSKLGSVYTYYIFYLYHKFVYISSSGSCYICNLWIKKKFPIICNCSNLNQREGGGVECLLSLISSRCPVVFFSVDKGQVNVNAKSHY